MTTLMIFMAVDYISGLIVAGVFKTARKRKMEHWILSASTLT